MDFLKIDYLVNPKEYPGRDILFGFLFKMGHFNSFDDFDNFDDYDHLDISNSNLYLLGECDDVFEYPKYEFINGIFYPDIGHERDAIMLHRYFEMISIILKLKPVNNLSQVLEIFLRDPKYINALIKHFE